MWTKTAPTASGVYWVRPDGRGGPYAVTLEVIDGESRVGIAAIPSTAGHDLITKHGYEWWSEKIEPPGESVPCGDDGRRPYLVLYRIGRPSANLTSVILRASNTATAVEEFRSVCGRGHFIEEIRPATEADIYGEDERPAVPPTKV